MTDLIAHRGPDGEGQYIDGPVALGHRRLAIIDLTDAARQPMVTRGQPLRRLPTMARSTISRNCKAELTARGRAFNSSRATARCC